MLGILLIDKEPGMTSHDVVAKIRRKLNTKRVGHAGTLDPMATGLLVIAVGPATRFLQYLPLEPKEYEFKVKFGQETNTQDAEGEVVATKDVPGNLQTLVDEFLPKLVGTIEQIPPMFSAVKKDGKPLYALARQGVEIEREPRQVTIFKLEVLGWEGEEAWFRCQCSGGTYVRTLAHDLGQMVGCGAHVTELNRVQVGRFQLEDAVQLGDLIPEDLIPLESALLPRPIVKLDARSAALAYNGQQVAVRPVPDADFVAIAEASGRVFGMAKVTEHGFLQPECVIPAEAVHG